MWDVVSWACEFHILWTVFHYLWWVCVSGACSLSDLLEGCVSFERISFNFIIITVCVLVVAFFNTPRCRVFFAWHSLMCKEDVFSWIYLIEFRRQWFLFLNFSAMWEACDSWASMSNSLICEEAVFLALHSLFLSFESPNFMCLEVLFPKHNYLRYVRRRCCIL